MRVIDLLNKIAKGKQPSHIRVYNRDWYWNNYDGYVTEGSLSTTPDAQIYLFSQYRLDFVLDKEVEIIEEPKKTVFRIDKDGISMYTVYNDEEIEEDKEIEEIENYEKFSRPPKDEFETDLIKYIGLHRVAINILIREINELKKGK